MMATWHATLRENAILSALPRLTEQPFYLVGGAVRDALRGQTRITDWDILVPRDAIGIARRFADVIGGSFIPLHDAQPTARVVQAGRQYDLSQYRAETLEGDLRRRDFTVNAIAADLRKLLVGVNEAVIDPCGGGADLDARLLRPCAPAAFRDDPLRALRLYRFVATLGYTPTTEAETLAAAVTGQLASIAPERITDELARLFAAPNAAPAIEGLARSGLWEAIVPEARAGRGMVQSRNHHLDVFDHDSAASVAVVGFLNTLDDWAAPSADTFRAWLGTSLAGERPRRWIVPLAALLHDTAKPDVRVIEADGKPMFPWHEQAGGRLAGRIAERLRLARTEENLLVAAIRQHGRPHVLPQYGPEHPIRLMAALGDAAPVCIMVAMGDRATARGPNRPPPVVAQDVAFLQRLLRDYFGRYAPLLATPSLVSGEDIMRALGLRPGREVGRLLFRLRWRQLAGIMTNADDALRLAAELHEP
ncbi:MAG: HD domain-containing protein [Thermomicrobia bacterium]|nr:HD domain-containing protein [Thermomicrobia bacterium]